MKFIPNFTVIHNGMTLQAGSPVEVTERDADALKAFGTFEKTAEKTAVPDKGKKGRKEQAKPVVADEDVI